MREWSNIYIIRYITRYIKYNRKERREHGKDL